MLEGLRCSHGTAASGAVVSVVLSVTAGAAPPIEGRSATRTSR